jgi:hypothetical protein
MGCGDPKSRLSAGQKLAGSESKQIPPGDLWFEQKV